jgi:hypothetical protein
MRHQLLSDPRFAIQTRSRSRSSPGPVYICFCYDANADILVQPPSRAGGVGFGFGTDLVWTWTNTERVLRRREALSPVHIDIHLSLLRTCHVRTPVDINPNTDSILDTRGAMWESNRQPADKRRISACLTSAGCLFDSHMAPRVSRMESVLGLMGGDCIGVYARTP